MYIFLLFWYSICWGDIQFWEFFVFRKEMNDNIFCSLHLISNDLLIVTINAMLKIIQYCLLLIFLVNQNHDVLFNTCTYLIISILEEHNLYKKDKYSPYVSYVEFVYTSFVTFFKHFVWNILRQNEKRQTLVLNFTVLSGDLRP